MYLQSEFLTFSARINLSLAKLSFRDKSINLYAFQQIFHSDIFREQFRLQSFSNYQATAAQRVSMSIAACKIQNAVLPKSSLKILRPRYTIFNNSTFSGKFSLSIENS